MIKTFFKWLTRVVLLVLFSYLLLVLIFILAVWRWAVWP